MELRHCIKLLFICFQLIIVNAFGYDIQFTSVTLGTLIIDEGVGKNVACSVSIATGYSISWYRETPRGDKTVIYRDGMLITSNLGREAEAYSIQKTAKLSENIVRTQLRITNQIGRNLGYLLNGNKYTCEACLNSTGEVVLASSGFILEAHYSPSPFYPTCEGFQFLSDFIGKSITISCYSELGEPRVELIWLKNGEKIDGLQTITTSSFIYLNYTFTLEANDLQSFFTCNNSVRSCNLTHSNYSLVTSSSTPSMEPFTTVLNNLESCKQMSSKTVTILSTIIAMLLLMAFVQGFANINLYKKLQQYRELNKKREQMITEEVGNTVPEPQSPDYINIKKSTAGKDRQFLHSQLTHSYINGKEQRNEMTDMTSTVVPVPHAKDYINVKQPPTRKNKAEIQTNITGGTTDYINVREPNSSTALGMYTELEQREEAYYSSLNKS